MYHFTAAQTNSLQKVVLSKNQIVDPHVSQCLRPFQIEAILFVDKHFSKGEFCVLNDESGLGKSVVVSVLLGAIPYAKKCLIIVQNHDDNVANWEFHLNVLTQLQVTVINSSKDTTNSPHNVYIAKWTTIRTIGDLSKFNFDCVIIDNRGETLSNNFCTSMLLKHFEKKVNMVVSSVDITSDIKLLHTILRLGGRLDPRYEHFKVFQDKFKLPDGKDTANKQIDFDLYFRKREMLCDHVKNYRLRRYRHQFDNLLPLVKTDTYALNVKLWQDAMNDKKKYENESVVLLSDSGSTIGTEQVLAQVAETSAKAKADFQKRSEPIEILDELDLMSPLFFFSDSENEEEQKKNDASPVQAEAAVNLLNICDEENNAVNKDQPKSNKDTTIRKRNVRKAANPKKNSQYTGAKKKAGKSSPKSANKVGEEPIKQNIKTQEDYTEVVAVDSNIPVAVAPKSNKAKEKGLSERPSQLITRKSLAVSTDLNRNPETKTGPLNIRKATKMAIDQKDRKLSQGKAKKITPKTGKRTLDIFPKGIHRKETRGMKRLTRSSDITAKSKYMKRSLALNIDNISNKPKRKVQTSKVKNVNKKDTTNVNGNKNSNKNDNETTKFQSENEMKETNNDNKLGVDYNEKMSSQMSLVSSSEYEDIQCGQKLDCNTESEVILSSAKPMNDSMFVLPAARPSQCSMLISSFTDPDLILISPPLQRQAHKTDVIVLSSSQDESSVSSQQSEYSRRTRALKQRKIALSNSQNNLNLSSFNKVLSNQDVTNAGNKSPDLFSNFSDVNGISCTQSSKTNDHNNDEVRPFDGFKIFGSEVKQYQQQYAMQSKHVSKTSSRERSCLDILEKMFEPRGGDDAANPASCTSRKSGTAAKRSSTARCSGGGCAGVTGNEADVGGITGDNGSAGTSADASKRAATKKSAKNKVPIMPAHPITAIELDKAVQAKKAQATKRHLTQKNEKELNKRRNKLTAALGAAADDDEIFEITNNATFGSMLRVNSNGDITPVPQTQTSKLTQRNKITQYFMGFFQTQQQLQHQNPLTQSPIPLMATPPDEDTLDSPGKRAQIGNSSGARKSPKNLKQQTQTTKLTRWLLKNNIESNDSATTDNFPTPATTPAAKQQEQKLTRSTAKNRRRRLEMVQQ